MAVITDQQASATIVKLQTRVRRIVGDTETVAANQRWTDGEINDAINLEMQKMSAEFGLGNSSPAITSTTLSYTADAESVSLPSGPDVSPIFKVEDYTNTAKPIILEHESFLEAGKYNTSSTAIVRGIRWSRVGASIALYPKSSDARTLRIWYLRAPYAFTLDGSGDETDAADQQPWPVQHEEIISLGAAIRLQEVDAEIPPGRVERYSDLWYRFLQSKYQNRGPIFVRNSRRYR